MAPATALPRTNARWPRSSSHWAKLEASTLLDIAADTFTDLYGPDHYEIGVIDGNRALIFLAARHHAAAERYVRNAIRIKTRHLGPPTPNSRSP
jgi:hypothetical protein